MWTFRTGFAGVSSLGEALCRGSTVALGLLTQEHVPSDQEHKALSTAGTYWFCMFRPWCDNRRRFIVIFLFFIFFILFFRNRGSEWGFWCCFCALWTEAQWQSPIWHMGGLIITTSVCLDSRHQSSHAHSPTCLTSKLHTAQYNLKVTNYRAALLIHLCFLHFCQKQLNHSHA